MFIFMFKVFFFRGLTKSYWIIADMEIVPQPLGDPHLVLSKEDKGQHLILIFSSLGDVPQSNSVPLLASAKGHMKNVIFHV